MSMDFLERFRNNGLTNVEDLRKMKVKLSTIENESESVDHSGESEEWKKWELAPLDAAVKPGAGSTVDTSSEVSTEAVKGVHKALRAIDKF